MRSETQPYSNLIQTALQYGCVALRMRFFSQNFGTIKRILPGFRHRLTAKALGPRLVRGMILARNGAILEVDVNKNYFQQVNLKM